MIKALVILCALLPLLSGCVSRLPDIPYDQVPAGPLMNALDRQRQRFSSLKALARVETARGDRRRVYESVAVVQRGFDRLRVEGLGPLGEQVFILLWDGRSVKVRTQNDIGMRTVEPDGLDRILGVGLAPRDLCAMLAGSSPAAAAGADIRAGCSADGRCAVDLVEGEDRWRIFLRQPADGAAGEARIDAVERYRGSARVLIARYERTTESGDYPLPRRLVMQSPERGVVLTVDYLDAEVNAPVDDGAFVPAEEDAGR